MTSRYELYKDASGEWRWRFRAANGEIVADSAEGYVNKDDAINGISIVQGGGDIVEVKD